MENKPKFVEKKPKFNVVEPFQGTIIVQMNNEMGQLLSEFISFVTTDFHDDEDVDNVEREIVAFGKALQDPVKSRELRDSKRERRRIGRSNGHQMTTHKVYEARPRPANSPNPLDSCVTQ